MDSSINSIRLIGAIQREPIYDHTVFGEAFYSMEVAAKRLSGIEDLLPVTVSERLLGDPEVNVCREGSRVEIAGQIRSYNRRMDDKNRLIITVFAREIAFPDICETVSADTEEAFGAELKPALAAPQAYVRDMNEAELSGTICKPVIYRTTPFDREIADLLIAVNRRYGKSDYIPCIAWGRNARFSGTLGVGDRVLVRGRLQSREYQKKLPDGSTEQRTAYEISCSSIERPEF